MTTLNASSVDNNQQWKDELTRKAPELTPNNDNIIKDLNMVFGNTVVETVCCSEANCDKAKVELMPDQFFPREPAHPPPFGSANPDGRDAPPGKKEVPVEPPEPYMPSFCPCVINRGHLVTYCCVRRDCDDASKIGGGIRERPRAYSHFKY